MKDVHVFVIIAVSAFFMSIICALAFFLLGIFAEPMCLFGLFPWILNAAIWMWALGLVAPSVVGDSVQMNK